MFPSHLMRGKPDGIRSGLILRQIILFHSGYTVLVRSVVDRWRCFKVSVRRRRRNRPFQRIRFPRVNRGLRPLEDAVEEVDYERDRRQTECERAERYKDVNGLLAPKMLVLSRIGYPAHHTVQTKVMHRIKG